MRSFVSGVLVLLMLGAGCGRKQQDAVAPVIGKVKMEDVYTNYPRFLEAAQAARIDGTVVQRLAAVDRDIVFMVFLGTWCSDSEEHVPVFHELLRAANNSHFQIEYYGVDRKKDDGLGLARRFEIERVPTFILMEGSEELGRIVETPTVSIGQDIASILEGAA